MQKVVVLLPEQVELILVLVDKILQQVVQE
jgi:hypothetical protein